MAFLQFAVILDFMWMAPLGAVIMPALKIGPKEFGLVVAWRMQPVADHLGQAQERSPFGRLPHKLAVPPHLANDDLRLHADAVQHIVRGNNLGVALTDLPTVYLMTGLCTIFVGLLVGRAAD